MHDNSFIPQHLIDLEISLNKDLRDVLKQGEIMWHQKSKNKWIKDDVRNTHYYHLKTITKRRRNKIFMLKDGHGHWIEDSINLKGMAVDFLQKLFRESIMKSTI